MQTKTSVSRLSFTNIVICLLYFSIGIGCTSDNLNKPPIAKRIKETTVVHDDKRVDFYAWMHSDNGARLEYLKAENLYSDEVLASTQKLQNDLIKELKDNSPDVFLDDYFKQGKYWFSSAYVGESEHPVFFRQYQQLNHPKEDILDINQLKGEADHIALGPYSISPDGKWLLYGLDFKGDEQYELFVKNLETQQVQKLDIRSNSSAFWGSALNDIFYLVDDDSKRSYRLFHFDLSLGKSELIYEETDVEFVLDAYPSRDRKHLIISSFKGKEISEYSIKALDEPKESAQTLIPRELNTRFLSFDIAKSIAYFIEPKSNLSRLFMASIDNMTQDKWKVLIESIEGTSFYSLDLYKNHVVIAQQKESVTEYITVNLQNDVIEKINLPTKIHDLYTFERAPYNSSQIYFVYQSFAQPPQLMAYDLYQKELSNLVNSGDTKSIDTSQYLAERLYITARDGIKIPVSLIYHQSTKLSKAPMLIEGYGAYGSIYWPFYRPKYLSFLDRGVVIVIAHVRGGGEKGKEWHEAGKLMNKQNSFNDFIDVAQSLVNQEIAHPRKLAISGSSAGGLLIGAVLNQRPELFKAAVLGVPFVDVLNTMLDPEQPLTTQEYSEWGNPNKAKAYHYIKTYSPYNNLKKNNYPAIYVYTSLNDSRVSVREPAKYVAKLRTMQTGNEPILLHTNLSGGHSGDSGRLSDFKDQAKAMVFVLNELDLVK